MNQNKTLNLLRSLFGLGTQILETNEESVGSGESNEVRDSYYPQLEQRANNGVERRNLVCSEMRVNRSGGDPKIEGYAAVFDKWSDPIFDFREKIQKGAFRNAISSNPDVRALFNHDPNFPLGRTTAGTLEIREDEKGLFYSISPPDTQQARDLMVSIERGDVSQSSFAFSVNEDGQRWGDRGEDGLRTRILTDLSLYDVSPVTFPAYPDATSTVRKNTNNHELEMRDKLLSLMGSGGDFDE